MNDKQDALCHLEYGCMLCEMDASDLLSCIMYVCYGAVIGVIEKVTSRVNLSPCTALPPPHPALLAFLPSHSRSSSTQSGGGLEADSRSSSRGSLEELSQYRHREAPSAPSCGSMGGMKQKMLLDYNVYMAKYVIPQASSKSPTATDSPGHSPESSPKTVKKV